jgi:NAD-dependent SIR2 family protein deacetylase
MIEEELKQDAEKSLDKRLGTYAYIRKQDCYTNYVDGYTDGAEPREKRIAELEAQIEKMKCCYNCKHSRTEYDHCKTDKSEKWEIKEK